jgi:hypothetical protein
VFLGIAGRRIKWAKREAANSCMPSSRRRTQSKALRVAIEEATTKASKATNRLTQHASVAIRHLPGS